MTSAIAFAEIMRGAAIQSDHDHHRAAAFFRVVPVLPFGEAAARSYREVAFKRGTFDRLIAAHALSLGLILVTSNEADFGDVPALRVENWTRP